MKLNNQLFAPADEKSKQFLASLKADVGITVEIKRFSNIKLHRKLFTLLNFAFELWEPKTILYKGIPVQKDFNRFRKDMVIAAGFYTPYFDAKGRCILEADSLSFAECDDVKKVAVYKGVLNATWAFINDNYHLEPEEMENLCQELLRFDR